LWTFQPPMFHLCISEASIVRSQRDARRRLAPTR
jgi:hypothetical protein